VVYFISFPASGVGYTSLLVVLQPEPETFFQLGLADRRIRARPEAGNPPGNGTAYNFEQINAFDSRCTPPKRLEALLRKLLPAIRAGIDNF
jgi:hypothetical protein